MNPISTWRSFSSPSTSLGKEEGVALGLSSIFLDRDALFRPELARNGQPDGHGRVMLQDWELGLAVNHALRYIKRTTNSARQSSTVA